MLLCVYLGETPKQGEIEETPKQKPLSKTPCAVVAGYVFNLIFSLDPTRFFLTILC